MDKKKALLNITISMIFKLVSIFIVVITKSFVVRKLGNEANGLYSLFVSILGFLSIAELGIGTAISFSMYKPIVEKNNDEVSALFYLYRKFYFIIFFVMLLGGLIVTPFLSIIAKGASGEINIYSTYLVFLISILITYLFAHKTSFINANKDNYLTSTIYYLNLILENLCQILIIIFTGSFFLFLLIKIFFSIIQWTITSLIFKKKYSNMINGNKKISKEKKQEVYKNARAMFYHKFGTITIETLNGVIISTFVSVIVLGKYSNYIVVMNGMISLLGLIFSQMTSIVGHLYANSTKERFYIQFKKTYMLNVILGFIFFLGYYSISDNLVRLVFGSNQELSDNLVLAITINYFIQFMNLTIKLYRDASGTFFYDRYRPIVEGIINLVLSIVFVKIWNEIGVLLATIITNLFISNIVMPRVLYKYAFNKKYKSFYFIQYGIILMFLLSCYIYRMVPKIYFSNDLYNLFFQGFLSVIISGTILYVMTLIYSQIKRYRRDKKNEQN